MVSDQSSPTTRRLTVESWSFYSVGILLIGTRIYSRRLTLGSYKNLQAEDYLMMLNACLYTVLMAAINVSSRTATNLLEPGILPTLTPEDIQQRIYGSKIVILLEQAMLLLTWGVKGCMVLMYHRLTTRLNSQLIVKLIAVYTVLGLLAVEMAWFLACRPFNGYWALPVPKDQCATYQHYSITQATFNLTSDLMMMGVAIPLLLRVQVPLKRKIILIAIFSCGLFVILAAVLNKYYNFTNPFTTVYMIWYIRESSTAIYVSNLPMLWPVFRHIFNVGTFADQNSSAVSRYTVSTKGYPLGTVSSARKKSIAERTMYDEDDRPCSWDSEERMTKPPHHRHHHHHQHPHHHHTSDDHHDLDGLEENGSRLEINHEISFTIEENSLEETEGGFDRNVHVYGGTQYVAEISTMATGMDDNPITSPTNTTSAAAAVAATAAVGAVAGGSVGGPKLTRNRSRSGKSIGTL